jgi:hypothetical protein
MVKLLVQDGSKEYMTVCIKVECPHHFPHKANHQKASCQKANVVYVYSEEGIRHSSVI